MRGTITYNMNIKNRQKREKMRRREVEWIKEAYLLNQSVFVLKLGQDYFVLAPDLYWAQAKKCARQT
jgi:hypothetical protein